MRIPVSSSVIAKNGQSWFDFLDDRGHLMVGTPDDVCEQIADLRDTCGLDQDSPLPCRCQESLLLRHDVVDSALWRKGIA